MYRFPWRQLCHFFVSSLWLLRASNLGPPVVLLFWYSIVEVAIPSANDCCHKACYHGICNHKIEQRIRDTQWISDPLEKKQTSIWYSFTKTCVLQVRDLHIEDVTAANSCFIHGIRNDGTELIEILSMQSGHDPCHLLVTLPQCNRPSCVLEGEEIPLGGQPEREILSVNTISCYIRMQ